MIGEETPVPTGVYQSMDVMGGHGQGFLNLGTTVLGGRNPCPYEIPPSDAAAGDARVGSK